MVVSGAFAQVTIFPFESSWKYLDNGTNQKTAWQSISFNDDSWKSGTGKFGYETKDLATIVSYGPDKNYKYTTTYFRKSFDISDLSGFPPFLSGEVTTGKQNGVIVYLNGTEIYRRNMPDGVINFTTPATPNGNEGDNSTDQAIFTIDRSLFVTGTNVIAAEVHLRKRTTRSLAFDLRLFAEATPPVVQSITRWLPSGQITNAQTVIFRTTFSEKVYSVNASDFTATAVSGAVSGTPISVRPVGIAGTTYDITVASVTGNGELRLDLKGSGTGITDAAGNAIAGGYTGGQTYTIDQQAPHVVSIQRQAPLEQNTTATEVTFRATFSEKVKGVDINDFLITGTAGGTLAAITPVGTSGTVYDVKLSSISGTGTLRLDVKSSGTGITDIAGNALSGGFTSGESYSISSPGGTAPIISSILRNDPATGTTTATEVKFAVKFSEPVTGVDVGDFILTKSGSVNGTITTLTGTGDSYIVTVSGISGAGTLRLDVKDAGTGITDATGNSLNSGFATGESYTIIPLTASYGFVSVTPLSSIPFNSDTQFKPQGKTWYYVGKWWCAINPAGDGTHIYRLDGTTWTDVLSFNAGGRTDCWVVGNLVHILIYRGTLESQLVSIEYDPASGTYKRWSQRTSATPISFPAGTEVATITVDGTGRLWTTSTKESATAGFRDVLVWYSDAPNYTSWSAPITIATNISDDDISAITMLPGKIGVLWSNQTTGLFGFKTHSDGSAPADWSADEMPASQSAISGDPRMADDHINMVVAGDGTLYAAIKTSYNTAALPLVGLLVRHPDGTWDDLHTVATGSEGGTQPIVVLNEQLGKVKVIYTTQTNGGDIVYKESPTSGISFGPVKTLISGGGSLYNFASSTHQVYNPDVVILATKITPGLPNGIVSVLASDEASPPAVQVSSTSQGIQSFSNKIWPTLAKRGTNITIQTASNRAVKVWVVDAYGRTMYTSTFAGTTSIHTAKLSAGVHYVTIKDNGKYETQKIVIVN
jgi:hypothetical protein